jgi:hypothetical protein
MSTSSTLIRSENSVNLATESGVASANPSGSGRIAQLTKSVYQADQQVKFFSLQAEVESLLQQLQALSKQKLSSSEPSSDYGCQDASALSS